MSTVSNSIGNRFTIGKSIGKGGFASVYLCEDESGSQYAVKCIELDEAGIPHPLELSLMASIRHPFLNPAHKIHVKDDMMYIFMDLAKSDLSKIVRKDKNPGYVADPVKVRKWLSSLVLAVSCLHGQKIIHADIKASNILVFGHEDNIRLSDFSLVMKFWKADTKYNHTIGTSTHRPLENLLQRDWDLSLDIWSLGVTIYEILYGTLIFPYQGDFNKKTKKDHINERCINCLIDWAERGPKKQHCNVAPYKHKFHNFNLVPEFYNDPYGLNDLLLKMLSIDPADRPTISQILGHPYFSGYQKPICTLIGTPTAKVKRGRLEKILNICNTAGLGSNVISLAIEMYSRINDLQGKKGEKDLKIYGCIWLASKITKKRVPSFHTWPVPLKKVLEMERQICGFLEFRLHHASNNKK